MDMIDDTRLEGALPRLDTSETRPGSDRRALQMRSALAGAVAS